METLNTSVFIDIQIQINAYTHALMYRVLGFDGRVEVASMMSSGILETSYILKFCVRMDISTSLKRLSITFIRYSKGSNI